ncbi:unnamed protein product [Linum tenue]|uniref:Uncharacterized protein n=1 Tax=Linum tenue TaxID=586396 RepID=A0AAV0IXM2_9ROSI|nr:unnamed protein product [Linum tenue]
MIVTGLIGSDDDGETASEFNEPASRSDGNAVRRKRLGVSTFLFRDRELCSSAVTGGNNWSKIQSYLIEGKVCSKFNETCLSDTVEQFYTEQLSALQKTKFYSSQSRICFPALPLNYQRGTKSTAPGIKFVNTTKPFPEKEPKGKEASSLRIQCGSRDGGQNPWAQNGGAGRVDASDRRGNYSVETLIQEGVLVVVVAFDKMKWARVGQGVTTSPRRLRRVGVT